MAIIDTIGKARQRGASDDEILQKVIQQNPQKQKQFEEAMKRGASSTAVLNEIVKQNAGLEQVKQQEEKNGFQLASDIRKQQGGFGPLYVDKNKTTNALEILPKIASTFKEGVEQTAAKAGQNELNKVNPFSGALQLLGGGAKTAIDTALTGAGGILSAITPDFIEVPIKQGFETALGKVGQVEAVQKAFGAWEIFRKEHPEAADNIGAVIDIASILPLGKAGQAGVKGVGKAGKVAVKEATTKIDDVAKFVGGKADDAVKNKAWEAIQPTLTANEQQIAAEAGKLTKKGVGPAAKLVLTPDATDAKMIEIAAPFVKNAKNQLDIVSNLKQGIVNSSAKLRTALKNVKSIWNKNTLKGKLDDIEIPITVKSDTTLTNQANYLKQAVLDLAEKEAKTPEGLLNLRQHFDDLVEKEFGSAVFDKTNTFGNLVREYRTTLNTFLDESVPLDAIDDIATRTLVQTERQKQAMLYRALDGAAETTKIGKVGETALRTWMRQNPHKANVIKAILTGLTGALGYKAIFD